MKEEFSAARLGQSSGSRRPLRLTLDPITKREIIRNATRLREDESLKDVYVNHDLTASQSKIAYLARIERRKGKNQTDSVDSDDRSPSTGVSSTDIEHLVTLSSAQPNGRKQDNNFSNSGGPSASISSLPGWI